MKKLFIGIIISAIAITAIAASQSPYSGQEAREIKALSSQEINDYLNGNGMGYARAAELNHYPGPKHVLELSLALSLSEEQVKQTQVLFVTMKANAADLGKQLVEKEQELDNKFAIGSIDKAILNVLVTEIGELQSKIRQVHLATHIEQKALLSEHQIKQYSQLRGYGKTHESKHSHSH